MVTVQKSADSELRKVSFTFAAPAGRKVSLAGSFNDWEQYSQPLEYSESAHVYCCDLQLPCGTYEYKLVVDGDWVTDPDNQNFVANDFGTLNSIIIVE